jgi:translocator protein
VTRPPHVRPTLKPATLSLSQQAIGFAGWLALCFAASAVGAFASVNAGGFYASLVRPAWAPPGWLFGPVWSVLFLCMAVAAWLVWRCPRDPLARPSKAVVLWLFVAQLAANALWSWLFFAWRLGGPAFAEVLLLWLLIACTIGAFWRFSRLASWLLVPYLLWVSFASVLNWTLWRANPAILG